MRLRISAVITGAAIAFTLTGCSTESAAEGVETDAIGTEVIPNPADEEEPDEPGSGESTTEVTIPTGARAASDTFAFPVPEDWEEREPWTEGTLGKDVTMGGTYEHPGDPQAAAATCLELLNEAGFNAYTYAPGELTNDASLLAEGIINGEPHVAILNFDTHADGYPRVVVIVTTDN